jgi:periplasmic copper chaperone A
MTVDFRRAAVGLACLAALCGGAAAPSSSISITAPWTRPAAAGGNGVGYMLVTNNSTGGDALLGGSSDAAERVEVHETTVDDKGVASMKKLDAVAIQSGQSIELKPAGKHVMFIGLKQPLAEGGVLKAKLKFKNAGDVDVDFPVRAAGPAAADGGGHEHMHHKP